jgi:hypothetical protein
MAEAKIYNAKIVPGDLSDRPLIGITGNAGTGKDTVGTAIQGWFGNQIEKLSFATRLKQMLATMLDVPYEMLEGTTDMSRKWREQPVKGIDLTPRQMMLSLGTEWGRDMVHHDLWVLLAKQQYEDLNLLPHAPGAYFTDVRFENEAKWIRDSGGILIATSKIGGDVIRIDHRSEAGIPRKYLDAVISAEHGDLDGLQSEALKTIRELGCHPSF